MVYVALFWTIAIQSISLSVLYMILFGIGTIPMLAAVVYVSNLLSFSFRGNHSKNNSVRRLVIIGMLFIIRGLSLDIPYLSK